MYKRYKNNAETGFTMVELLVSMAVFIVAISIVTGLFVESIRSQRQISEILATNSDAGVVLELMAREIRAGYDFSVSGGGCGPGGAGVDGGRQLSFVKVEQNATTTVTYGIDSQNVERSEEGSVAMPLNSSGVNVSRLCFLETQNDGSNGYPWRVTILMGVEPDDPDVDYQSNYQTTVSARLLPVET